MSRFLRIFAAAAALGLLCGCMRTVRLKDRAIVQAVGVDYQDGLYSLSFQYFMPEQSSGTPPSGNTFTSQGETMAQAVEQAARGHGRQVFFGSNKIIILGQGMARQGVRRPIGYFADNHQLDPGTYILLASGDARDIVAPQGDAKPVPASAIEKLADTAKANRHMAGGTMLDAVTKLEGQGAAADLPLISLVPGEAGGEPQAAIEGAGLLKAGKLVDTLTEEETRGSLWLAGTMKNRLLTLTADDGGKATVEILSSAVKKRPRAGSGGEVVFEITVQADAAPREYPSGAQEDPSAFLQKSRALLESDIRRCIRMALEKTVEKHQADIFQLGALLRKHLPRALEGEGGFDAVLQAMRFEIHVSCRFIGNLSQYS